MESVPSIKIEAGSKNNYLYICERNAKSCVDYININNMTIFMDNWSAAIPSSITN